MELKLYTLVYELDLSMIVPKKRPTGLEHRSREWALKRPDIYQGGGIKASMGNPTHNNVLDPLRLGPRVEN